MIKWLKIEVVVVAIGGKAQAYVKLGDLGPVWLPTVYR